MTTIPDGTTAVADAAAAATLIMMKQLCELMALVTASHCSLFLRVSALRPSV